MYVPRYKEKYDKEVIPALKEQFGFKSVMRVPKIKKICLNQGLGKFGITDKKLVDLGVQEMTLITGQKAVATKSKKDISNFKLRRGMPIGVRVTLRGEKMYEFLDRLVNLALPRVRDFRGVSADSFDGRGNYAMGIKEQIIFPEIEYDKIDKVRGMEITFVTTATNDEQAYTLLEMLGMPFRKG